MINTDATGRMAVWSATPRAVSIYKGATIAEVSQAIVSKLVLSDDFPYEGYYPCATFSVKVFKPFSNSN